MSERPPPPPEGRIITEALKRAQLSAREAARRAGISEARWRQITSGYQRVGQIYAQVRGPADTTARMARVAGARAEDFEAVDRSDIAVAMRKQEAESAAPSEDLTGFDFANFVPETETEKALVALFAAVVRERESNADLSRRLEQVEEKLQDMPQPEQGRPGQDNDEHQRGA